MWEPDSIISSELDKEEKEGHGDLPEVPEFVEERPGGLKQLQPSLQSSDEKPVRSRNQDLPSHRPSCHGFLEPSPRRPTCAMLSLIPLPLTRMVTILYLLPGP